MSKMDRNSFVSAMRCVANSVTVVTTNGVAGKHGATVSAFCSVSADPPTALVCLNSSSKISAMVLENGVFNINVLPDDAEHLAMRFAGFHDAEIDNRFEDVHLHEDELPAIDGATVFSCILDQAVSSGSHQIVIGRVTAVKNSQKYPLTYLDGNFHTVSPIEHVLG